jgi:hypothetical protein
MEKKYCSKKLVIFLLMSMLILSSYQTVSEKQNRVENISIDSNEFFDKEKIVSLSVDSASTVAEIIRKGIEIIEINSSQNVATVFANAKDILWFTSMNYSYEIIFDSYAHMNGWIDNPLLLLNFTSYDDLTTQMADIEFLYPEIAQLYDIGQSVQGRSIWALKITDNPSVKEFEPKIRICGAHHGNELMSVEMPLLLAWYLVENYQTDPYIEDLVNNREIWIIPMVNPDGRESMSRVNANGVDINRDYGYMWDGEGGSPAPFSQPETKAIREHALENNFVLSLSFHTSGDIVNSIWNYKGQHVPDYDVVYYLSELYASFNDYTLAVNGYDWYQIKGDTNDFSYGCRGDIDWTIEVQNNNIAQAWDLNRDAMIEIIQAADMGVKGVVTDAISGEPVRATLWVDEAFWPCFTDPTIGDYHRVLLPGVYTVSCKANGYQEQSFTVEVFEGQTTVLNFSLVHGSNYYAHQVTSCSFYDPYSFPNNYQNNPTEAISALGAPDGVCASLGVGGNIVLDMQYAVVNQPDGNDLKIYVAEDCVHGYDVLVSQQFNGPWMSLGSSVGTTEFDLSNAGVDWIKYVKIIDDNVGDPFEQNPGVDIDAVENLGGVNFPPYIPDRPTGPTQGYVFGEYAFSTVTLDPEGDEVYYQWDFGDGTVSDWVGPYPSGEQVEIVHVWEQKGSYNVSVKAKDSGNAESMYSLPLLISIKEGPVLEITSIDGGFGRIHMSIENTGTVDAIGVDWSLTLNDGFILVGRESSGRVLGIAAGEKITVHSDVIVGLGKTTISGVAQINDSVGDYKEVEAKIFLFLISF